MKKRLMGLVLLLGTLLLAGCLNQYADVEIKEDGTALLNMDMQLNKEYFSESESEMDKTFKNAEKSYKKIDNVEYICYTYAEEYKNLNALKTAITTEDAPIALFRKAVITTDTFEGFGSEETVSYADNADMEKYITVEMSVTMPSEIINTNGVIDTSNPCKVQWKTKDYLSNNRFYAYCAGSARYEAIKNDKKAPVIKGVKNKGLYKKAKFTCTDNVDLAKVTLNKTSYVFSDTITWDGNYTLVATDLNGNKTTVKFTVDATKPNVSGVIANKTYKKAVTVKVKDKNGLKSVQINGKKKSLTKAKSGIKISKNGTYKVVAVDKAGNKTTLKFKIKK